MFIESKQYDIIRNMPTAFYDSNFRFYFFSKEYTEVTNISPFGFWLVTGGREYFISFEDYPVFENASIIDIVTVEVDVMGNLHWRNLDADIEIDALENPNDYPLVDKGV